MLFISTVIKEKEKFNDSNADGAIKLFAYQF